MAPTHAAPFIPYSCRKADLNSSKTISTTTTPWDEDLFFETYRGSTSVDLPELLGLLEKSELLELPEQPKGVEMKQVQRKH